MRTPGKRVCRKATRVRIPAHPPLAFALAPAAILPNHPPMRLLVVCLLALASLHPSPAAGAPDRPALGNLLEAARADYAAGALPAALDELNQHEQARGQSVDSLDLRGMIAFEQGKNAEASQAFEAAHRMQPELFSPRLHLADLLLREKKFGEARVAYAQLAKETSIPTSNERARYGELVANLGLHDDAQAQIALGNIKFPTETPAYYCAHAAAEFAAGHESAGKKWLATARQIFPPDLLVWFARPLFDLGWLKDKPPPPTL